MRRVQWCFEKDMGVGLFGRRVNANSKSEREEYHIFRLFKVEQNSILPFLGSLVHTLRCVNLNFVICCAQIGAIGAKKESPLWGACIFFPFSFLYAEI